MTRIIGIRAAPVQAARVQTPAARAARTEVTQVTLVEGGLPDGGAVGDILMKTSSGKSGASWVTPANNAEADNTRPITAAAVYTEIGNINALLATI